MRTSLSDFLKSTLPLPQVARIILNNGQSAFSWMWPRTSTCPISGILLGSGTLTLNALPPTIPPVVFARKLVELALCLLQPSFKLRGAALPHVNPDQTAKHYIDAAQQVTSHDLLVKSVDGLETLLLEALYQVHLGNTDLSCNIFRRAIGIAQSMELHRLPSTADTRVKHLWFRLMYTDRWHALGYGLPSAVMDTELIIPHWVESASPTQQLDVRHIDIAGHIIARNVRLTQKSGIEEAASRIHLERVETENIDRLLISTTRTLPTNFWALPNQLAILDGDPTEMTAKLMAHIHQSYLILLAHQPWVLLALDSHNAMSAHLFPRCSQSYGQIASLSAARDLLSRIPYLLNYPHLRASLRGVRHKIHVAATAMLLLHLHDCQPAGQDMCAHQRPHDLNLLSEMFALVENLYQGCNPGPHGETMETLEGLLGLIQDVLNGSDVSIEVDWCSGSLTGVGLETQEEHITVSYPYFGRLRVIQHMQAAVVQ